MPGTRLVLVLIWPQIAYQKCHKVSVNNFCGTQMARKINKNDIRIPLLVISNNNYIITIVYTICIDLIAKQCIFGRCSVMKGICGCVQ